MYDVELGLGLWRRRLGDEKLKRLCFGEGIDLWLAELDIESRMRLRTKLRLKMTVLSACDKLS